MGVMGLHRGMLQDEGEVCKGRARTWTRMPGPTTVEGLSEVTDTWLSCRVWTCVCLVDKS